jgi:hypothetical protein
MSKTLRELFFEIYQAGTEDALDDVISSNHQFFQKENWYPLGGDANFFGIVRNQQSSPIAALVEKVTNSIDAILTKRCYEEGIAPTSPNAPRSMYEALQRFYPNHKQWDLKSFRRQQAEEIQIIADGPPRNTSVIIYDNGEGQYPEDFEKTFLSLVRGNKVNIHFVQGKYNMGGSGALIFCGKKRYQLVASKKFDGTGQFGFTLVREHKAKDEELRGSYFEYLKIDEKIPSFDITELDLKLHGRKFRTGSIIKLYSYQFPPGYAGFAQDLNQSLNEYLFEPILPLLTVDKKERYPHNKVLELDLYGLKRRLEEDKSDYVQEFFSEDYTDQLFGHCKVTCYVFKPKLEGRDVKKSKEIIRDRFFRNNMSVMFSINGQVHGSYTSEFITRTLKFNLLKDYLLIHVDCTHMNREFRDELFMASRDRLKNGDEASDLREFLGKKLRASILDDINRRRKESIGLESEDTSELIRSLAKNLPKESDLFKLLQNAIQLEESNKKKDGKTAKKPSREPKEASFNPQRFPSYFKLRGGSGEHVRAVKLPLNGEKTVTFDTDVENEYFDRVEEPGELTIALLKVRRQSDMEGGNQPGHSKDISDYLNVVKRSPNNGTIKLTLNATKELKVDDEVELKVSLSAPGEPLEQLLLVKVGDPEAPKEQVQKHEQEADRVGLPSLKVIKEHDWPKLEENGISMGYDTVIVPIVDGDTLTEIYVNVDSRVFLTHRRKLKSEEQIRIAQKKYVASVYFHSLFLYLITKKRQYAVSVQQDGKTTDITVDQFISDVFENYYSEFLLNFGMDHLMAVLED